MIDRTFGKAWAFLRYASSDPVEAWIRLRSHLTLLHERNGPLFGDGPYAVTTNWERQLHDVLGLAWPCPATAEFWKLWPEVIAPFYSRGIHIGRGAFGGWGDGEPGLARAAWCLVRHLRPISIVETGVARGFTSRIILEALERNGAGHLWSIDLPPPTHPDLHPQIGAAVGDRLRHRWSYIKGSSRRRLPRLLKEIGEIDLFIHDSAHSRDNVNFELGQACARLRPGGAIVVDDIDYSSAFHNFTQVSPLEQFFVCHAEPLEPDPIRFDAKGLFGIALKAKTSALGEAGGTVGTSVVA